MVQVMAQVMAHLSTLRRSPSRILALSLALIVGFGVGLGGDRFGVAQAQTVDAPPSPSDDPLDELNAPPRVMSLLRSRVNRPQITEETPSQRSLTVPGLWWTNQLFGDKLVIRWFAYRETTPANSQVRLIIRPDLWSRYSYLERYTFLRSFGRTSSQAGYNLLVLDRQNFPLGSYTCEFPSATAPLPIHPLAQPNGAQITPFDPRDLSCQAWISPVYQTTVL